MKCPRCKKNKPRKSFYRTKVRANGLQYYCKSCARGFIRTWEKAHPEKIKAASFKFFRKRYNTPKGRAYYMLDNAKANSKRKDLPCTLTRRWIERKLQTNVCELTGLPFTWEKYSRGNHRTNSFSPSIDRINPDKGYTPLNCRIVVWILNRAMGAFPREDFNQVMQAYCKKNLCQK